MKTIKKSLVLLAAGGVLSLGAVTDVSARSFGSAAGRALNASDAACFDEISGIVFNNHCGTARTFEVQLPADASGSKSVNFTAAVSASCTAFATDRFNTSFTGSNTILITSSGYTSQTLSSFNLASGGKLWLQCSIGSGGFLSTVNYNQ